MREDLPPRKKFGSNLKPVQTRQGNTEGSKKDIWLTRAKDAFDISTSYVDTNYRKDWEDSIRHFQGRHMAGSKYYSESYKHRSKMFRPKTRSTVRQVEAATAAAFFSQLDVITVEAEDEHDHMSLAGSALRQELLNYRLSGKKQIPWYQICVGAMQEAEIYGIVISKQYWDFREREVEITLSQDDMSILDQEGNPAKIKQTVTVMDQPDIKLYPIENIRFDPAAEWTNVVETSPYFIAMEAVRVSDVKEKIESGEWQKVDEKLLLQARNSYFDSTRSARQNDKEDDKDPRHSRPISDFDMVWVHENFMYIDGEDMQYYTLGTIATLSKPRPLKEAYLHGVRPFVVGTCVIEPHKAIPDAPVHLIKGTQKEANQVANTRLDNVLLALNKRWLVKRGKQVDLQSLVRNAPGSVTLVNDVQGDVLPVDFNDVTGSAYAEQDRINVDLDELMGSFSAGSVATNRKLGETVGGLQMLRGTSNTMGQYLIRVFSETWVEKVLNQLDELEQYYESDMELLGRLARRANLESHGVQSITKDLLMAPARVTVNVANSAQDPTVRLELFTYAMRQYAEFRANMPPDMDPEPIKAYIFGLLGFRDASRFSIDTENQDPRIGQLEQQLMQMQEALESKMMEIEAKNQSTFAKIQSDENIKMAQMLSDRQRELADQETKSMIAEMNNITKILIEDMKQEQMEMKEESSENAKLAISALEQRTQDIMARVGDTSSSDAIREAVAQIAESFKALADKDSDTGIADTIKALQENSMHLASLAKTLGAPRENEVIERDADGVPTRTRSRIVNG